jgi:hypothetical protein
MSEVNTATDYFNSLPETQRPLAESLRLLIQEAAPELTESLKWGFPSYGEKKNICYLAAKAKHINLGFYDASKLTDPESLLEGTGAKMRHVKIRKAADLKPEALRQLIREAVLHGNN